MYFALGFKNFAQQTKLAAIPHYENFFLLHLINGLGVWELLWLDQYSSRNVEKIFFGEI